VELPRLRIDVVEGLGPRVGIGRRDRLKIGCRKAYRFKSCRGYEGGPVDEAKKTCPKCGSITGCARDKGWPCTAQEADAIAKRAGYGGRGDYRSYWD